MSDGFAIPAGHECATCQRLGCLCWGCYPDHSSDPPCADCGYPAGGAERHGSCELAGAAQGWAAGKQAAGLGEDDPL